jgi:hypothetical protein
MIETIVMLLGGYVLAKLRGPLDRRVDAALDQLLSRMLREAAGHPSAQEALSDFMAHPTRRTSRRLAREIETLTHANPQLAGDLAESLRIVDQAALIVWVAEHTNIDQETVEKVLDLKDQYMTARGIIDDPGRRLEFYTRLGVPLLEVDDTEIARDANEFLGIDYDIAIAIQDAEFEYLVLRGIAER